MRCSRRSRVGTGINRGGDNGILDGGRIDTAAKCRVPRGRIEIRRRNRGRRCRMRDCRRNDAARGYLGIQAAPGFLYSELNGKKMDYIEGLYQNIIAIILKLELLKRSGLSNLIFFSFERVKKLKLIN